jgi:LuxR family transcriptional regulator, maltose regulon positive regulatory protein
MSSEPDGGGRVLRILTPRSPDDLPVEVLESKLYRPTIRSGVIPRPYLLDRLGADREVPVVTITAPAGYGKTTLLALWLQADDRPCAWLSIDPHDNDPVVFLTHLSVALHRVTPLPPEIFDALRAGGMSVAVTVVPRLGRYLSRLRDPLVLALDDVHHLRDGASLDALVALVGHVRGPTQVALAGRSMPVPLGGLRAQGRTVEIGMEELAFHVEEAASLLRAAGADLSDEDVVALAERTEGWPAGLYLAALARTRPATSATNGSLRDGDRLAEDYLQSELLSGLPEHDLAFLSRTSVLDRLSAPLCDAVLQETGSAAVLEHLTRDNLFLVPLDGRGQWYRYHSLFRQLLRTRLENDGRDEARALSGRAAAWFEREGRFEIALHYAQDAEDVDSVARLTTALAQPMYAAGRSTTALAWVEWLDARDAIERHPVVAALAAYLCALTGRPAAADRWADLAERWAGRRTVGDGDPAAAMWLTTLRGMMCRHGVDRMRRDVEDYGRSVLPSGTAADPEYPMRLFLSGVAHLLQGDVETAEIRLSDATELIAHADRAPLHSVMLAYRALIPMSRGQWEEAEALVSRAASVADRGHTRSHITSVIVVALAARVAWHRGDLPLARVHLSEAQRLRPLLSYAGPWYAVACLLEMAEVSLDLGDPGGADVYVQDAEAVLLRRHDLGSLGPRTHELRERLGSLQAAAVRHSTLTSAELRILPLLVTHLSIAGIAERLFLSRHTVKAQLESMYRKLDVHSRDAAVDRARALGLLEG